jgi:hypothetical protein
MTTPTAVSLDSLSNTITEVNTQLSLCQKRDWPIDECQSVLTIIGKTRSLLPLVTAMHVLRQANSDSGEADFLTSQISEFAKLAVAAIESYNAKTDTAHTIDSTALTTELSGLQSANPQRE